MESSPCSLCTKIAGEAKKEFEQRTDLMLVGYWGDFIKGQDCPTCQRIVKHFQRATKDVTPEWIIVIAKVGHKENQFYIRLKNPKFSGYTRAISGFTSFIETDQTRINLQRIKTWVLECDSYHTICQHSSWERFFPLPPAIILIDVRRRCLVIPEGNVRHSLPIRYIALSYVWGRTEGVFKNIKSKRRELFEDGSLSNHWGELPATVKDAILLTEALAIPYLWVDRLCIVQDDNESLKHNISWMASIYANTYFTIIATEGADDEFGLRGTGAESKPRDFYPFWYFNDVQLAGDYFTEEKQTWHTRAWTFQERAVSKRCLVFFRGTVKWECQEWEVHEHVPFGIRSHYRESWPRHNISIVPWPDYNQYCTLSSAFSEREIRFQNDALKAFTAIINSFAPTFPGGFMHALPEFVFDFALAWKHEGEASRRPMFPSWSWIGWNGKTRMQEWFPLLGQLSSRRPMVRWLKKRVDIGILEPIDNSYREWCLFENNNSIDLPDGWERHFESDGSMYYRFCGDFSSTYGTGSVTKYRHPIPVTWSADLGTNPPDANIFQPFLYGLVQSTTCILGSQLETAELQDPIPVNIHNEQGSWIGVMEANNHAYTIGTECTVIAISRVTQAAGYEIESRSKPEVRNEGLYSFIQVLWISWDGNIAYRKGVGRIWKKKWEEMEAKKINIVLG